MIKVSCSLLSAVALIGLLGTLPASADAPEKVVHTDTDGIAVNTFGNCVRTKWTAASDPCAAEVPKPVRKPIAQVVSPARELKNEERTVYFDFNKDTILPEEAKKLDTLAEVLKSDKDVKSVSIVGYADHIGTAGYNEELSKRRAASVEAYLHSREYMNTSLAKVRWLGDTAPVTHCDKKLKRTALIACLQKDRRVEVEIEYVTTDGAQPTK